MIVDDEVEALSDTQRAMLRASAEAGDPDAQHELGARLSRGEGIDASPTEGARWLALAASQGHAEAQFRLSRSYAQGRGVPKDNGQMLRWLSEAANQNHASARVQMGIHLIRGELVPKDFVRAVELLSRPAEEGHHLAQVELGDCYRYGWGVSKDEEEAFRWYMRAAERGHGFAQYRVASCYWQGCGVRRDIAAARTWVTAAAKNGHDGTDLFRIIVFEDRFKIRTVWYERALVVLGYVLLAHYVWTRALSFSGRGLLLFFGVVASLFVALYFAPLPDIDKKPGNVPSASTSSLPRVRAIHLLRLLALDGLFAVPVLYLGATPIVTFASAVLFGLTLYPKLPPRRCIAAAAMYFAALALLLPYGLGTFILGHVMWGVFLSYVASRLRKTED